jgi:hypothetical protein
MTIIIDPFETPPPSLSDTVPTAVITYNHLTTQILRLEADFCEIDNNIRQARESLDAIVNSSTALAKLYRKDRA